MLATDKNVTDLNQLPVAGIIDDLASALRNHPSAVLVAPPGAGKTTAVPLKLINQPWMSGRRMIVLGPRRITVRAAAHRMAGLLGQPVGQTIGYRVRMDSRVGPRTRIEVVTEGILTRMLQNDPVLADIGLVIFDEFHERSLDADLGLALCRDIQGVLNENLRILVMSATLDPAPVSELLDNAPLVRCEGRTFSVDTRYHDKPAPQDTEQAIVRTIRHAVKAEEGNLLVFLPGVPEIHRIQRALDETGLPQRWLVTPLYGNLPRDRQNAAIAPPPTGHHKIVLATSVAETSLTIEGIGVVVDSGLQRMPRFDPVSGMTRLVTLPVSRASADQRRGRAGRLGPGICYRLWNRAHHQTLVPHNRPEIMDNDLVGLALELAVWGLSEPEALKWLDPPPAAAFNQARQLLGDLMALDDRGTVTPHGRRMAALPLHPRLAHMILSARGEKMGVTACDMAAILSEREIIRFDGRERDADLELRLEALQAYRNDQSWQRYGYRLIPSAAKRVSKVSSVLRKRLELDGQTDDFAHPGRILAWAYPDRIARRRTDRPGRFRLTSGRGAFLDRLDPLSASDYLVAAHLDGKRQDARIFMAAATDRNQLLEQFEYRIHWRESVIWEAERQMVTACRKRVLGAITIETEPLSDPMADAVLDALVTGVRRTGIGALPWTPSLRNWQSRVCLLARIDAPGGPWPDLGDIQLDATVDQWLAPYLAGITRFKDIGTPLLGEALAGRLTWQQRRRLEQLAPTHITVPSGFRRPIDYSQADPILAVRIQEMFGAAQTPTIADGRLPLVLHLLSPAGRPVQITRDLAGFWVTGYPSVKKELKGRYPKHAWPENPLGATPTARVRPRRTV
ncbi:MAG: ATP-dependent helicase HrpB [Proteobacteria bacterium]|nr:MAG: ATP-dependent helicase HrpB [Pseudomonadota bacterium]PIE67200.1 MAG: ATP-dependent helicase HrpB [Deltaproteobacteria bacterium]